MTTEELLLKIGGDASGAVSALNAFTDAFKGSFAEIAEGVAVGELLAKAIEKVFDAIKELPAEFIELAKEGSTIVGVEDAFDTLAQKAGTTGDVLRNSLTEGVKGTVTQFELMKDTAKLLGSGMQLTGDQASLMGQAARALGKATGQDAAAGLEIMSQALVTGRVRGLQQQIGLIDLAAGEKKFADSLGVTVDQLNEAGKLEGKRIAVLEATQAYLDRVGDSELSLKEKLQQAETAFSEWYEGLAKAVAQSPNINAAVDAIGQAFQDAFGDAGLTATDALLEAVNALADVVKDNGPLIIQAIKDISVDVQSTGSEIHDLWDAVPQTLKNIATEAGGAQTAIALLKGALLEATGVSGTKFFIDTVKDTIESITDGINDAITAYATLKVDMGGELKIPAPPPAPTVDVNGPTNPVLPDESGIVPVAPNFLKDVNEKAVAALEKSLAKTQQLWDQYYETQDKMAGDDLAAKLNANQRWYDGELATLTNIKNRTANTAEEINALDMVYLAKNADARKAAETAAATEVAAIRAQIFGTARKIEEGEDAEAEKEDADAEKRKESARETGLQQLGDAYQQYTDYVNQQTMSSTDYQVEKIQEWAQAQKAGFKGTADQYAEYQKYIDGLAAKQIDLANATADTIEQRMRALGVYTIADLDAQAAAARRDYQQMAADGAYSAQELVAAFQKAYPVIAQVIGDISNLFGGMLQSKLSGTLAQVAQMGSQIGETALKASSMGDKLAGAGVAGAIGMAGLTFGISAAATGAAMLIKKFTDTEGRDAVVKFAQSFADPGLNNGFDNLRAKLDALGAEGDSLWKTLTQGVGKNDPKAAQAAIDAITAAFDKQQKAAAALTAAMAPLNKDLGNTLTSLEGLGAGDLLQPFIDQLENAKGLTADNLALVQQLAGDTTVSYDQMQKAADALGIKTANLGQAFESAKAQADWQSVIDNLDTLQRGGANLNDLLGDEGLQKKISDLVNSSIQFGTTIPENAKPWVEQLAAAGKLLDANGNKITDTSKLTFGESLQTSMQKLVDKISALLDKITAIPGALDKIPAQKDVSVVFTGKTVGDWPTGDDGTVSGDSVGRAATGAYVTAAGLIPLALAGGGFVPRGTDTIPAMLTPGELVLNATQQGRLADALARPSAPSLVIEAGAIVIDRPILRDRESMVELAQELGQQLQPAWAQLGAWR